MPSRLSRMRMSAILADRGCVLTGTNRKFLGPFEDAHRRFFGPPPAPGRGLLKRLKAPPFDAGPRGGPPGPAGREGRAPARGGGAPSRR